MRIAVALVLVVACGGKTAKSREATEPVANMPAPEKAPPRGVEELMEAYMVFAEELAEIADANRTDCERMRIAFQEHFVSNDAMLREFGSARPDGVDLAEMEARYHARSLAAGQKLASAVRGCPEILKMLVAELEKWMPPRKPKVIGVGDPNKKPEAVANIQKIYAGAKAYYDSGANQFPMPPGGSISSHPVGHCCTEPGRKCAPAPDIWTDPVWQALRFDLAQPHFYTYHYTAAGSGKTSQFSATAHGDLDCDGVYSTFEMVGRIQTDGTVTGQAGLFRDMELE